MNRCCCEKKVLFKEKRGIDSFCCSRVQFTYYYDLCIDLQVIAAHLNRSIEKDKKNPHIYIIFSINYKRTFEFERLTRISFASHPKKTTEQWNPFRILMLTVRPQWPLESTNDLVVLFN